MVPGKNLGSLSSKSSSLWISIARLINGRTSGHTFSIIAGSTQASSTEDGIRKRSSRLSVAQMRERE
jgi:hypothetical protein